MSQIIFDRRSAIVKEEAIKTAGPEGDVKTYVGPVEGFSHKKFDGGPCVVGSRDLMYPGTRPGAEAMVDYLNELLKIDPFVMHAMFGHYAKCNEQMANHPTVQVTHFPASGPAVSMLGILNGFFGTYSEGPWEGWGPIAGYEAKDGTIARFGLTVDTKPPSK